MASSSREKAVVWDVVPGLPGDQRGLLAAKMAGCGGRGALLGRSRTLCSVLKNSAT
jgi:hypothetical protein